VQATRRTRAPGGLGQRWRGRVRVGDEHDERDDTGSHPSAAQGAGVQAGSGLGRKASWAACGAGLLRGWKRQGGLASAAVGPAGCCGLLLSAGCWAGTAARVGLLRPDGLGGGGLGRVGLKV
jgi:hypothetical protein